jgi:hypothetical protein
MSYPLIKKVFSKVLSSSKTIQGRVFFMPKYMAELNTNDLEQQKATAKATSLKDGPLVAILPPVGFGSYRDGSSTWTRYVLTLYFLRTSSVTEAGQLRSPSPMSTTQSTLMDDWEVMRIVARDTLRTADKWFREGAETSGTSLINLIRFKSKGEDTITPTSLQGNDRWSGVKVVSQIEVNEDCTITEFTEQQIIDLVTNNL